MGVYSSLVKRIIFVLDFFRFSLFKILDLRSSNQLKKLGVFSLHASGVFSEGIQMRKSWTRKNNPKELRENRQKMKLKMPHLCEFGADTWRSEHYCIIGIFSASVLSVQRFSSTQRDPWIFFLHFLMLPNPQVSSKSRKNWILHLGLFQLKVMRSKKSSWKSPKILQKARSSKTS